MSLAIFHLKRDIYGHDSKGRETTLSKMFNPSGDFVFYCLEDVVRAYGIKDKTRTAIPQTEKDDTYFLRVMHSPKYGQVVTVYTHLVDGVPVLKYGGIEFSYIRCHGGNDADDTEGCLLVNKNRTTDEGNLAAWGSQKKEFAKLIQGLTDDGYDCRLRVSNLPQLS